MPPLKDENTEIEDLDSSATSHTDDQPTDPKDKKVEGEADDANSSNATSETGDDDLLSVVRDVRTKRQDSEADAASQAAGEEDGSQTGEPRRPDDENFSDVPFNKHPRFRQLLTQRNEYKVDAERYRNVQNFLDDSGLEADEAADGLQSMALAKSNPVEAWKRVKPWVQKLLIAAGEVLPDDLQRRVAAGELSADAAGEVSRSRAQAQTVEVQRSLDEQRRTRQETRGRHTAVMDAVRTWEADRVSKDPGFEAKRVPLHKEIAYLQSIEGKPTTPEAARDQLARAYKAVNSTLRAQPQPRQQTRQQQQRQAIRPVTSSGQVAGNKRPEPKTTMDIVKNVVAKHRGG